MRTQRTELIREPFGQHRDCSINKIYRCSALHCLVINNTSRANIVCHIGNMYTDLPLPVTHAANRECIVKVLCISRVDSKCRHISHIATLGIVLSRNCAVNLGSSLHYRLVKLIRQIILKQYGMHLCIIIARATQNIDQLAYRHLVAIVPLSNTHSYLISRLHLRILLAREVYIHRKATRVSCNNNCTLRHHLRHTGIAAIASLDNLGNLALQSTCAGSMSYNKLDNIAIECML